MAILSSDNMHLKGLAERRLRRVFRPIQAELQAVEMCLDRRLCAPRDATVRDVMDLLRRSPGKRLRPALVLLAHRVAAETHNGHPASPLDPVPIAAAVELVHMASLVHDDLIDAAPVRHHRASVNARWGGAVSIALGDYLCAGAFQLLVECGDPQMLPLLGSALCTMCEGEMVQVMARGNFALSEADSLAMVEKKTAALFAACCACGAAAADTETATQDRLRRFGVHLGIAFQILDDCEDLLGDQSLLGKRPAQDLLAGDVTLPLLLCLRETDREDAVSLDSNRAEAEFLDRVREAFRASDAGARIEQQVRFYADRAKEEIRPVPESEAKSSLGGLADYIAESASTILAR